MVMMKQPIVQHVLFVTSSVVLILVGLVTNVNFVDGQCCATNNYPTNGADYLSLYGIQNATNVHLCFDGGFVFILFFECS